MFNFFGKYRLAKIYHILDNIYRISGKIVWDLGLKLKSFISFRIKIILYFQSTGRKLMCNEKEIRTFYGKLNEIEKQIQKMFLRIHKSYY